jgi:hypothetical protein
MTEKIKIKELEMAETLRIIEVDLRERLLKKEEANSELQRNRDKDYFLITVQRDH